MLADHVYEGRTAGCSLLLSFFISLCPFLSLISGRHVTAETDLDHVGKAHLLKGRPPACHGDVGAEFAFNGRCQHGDNLLASLDGVDDLGDEYLGGNGTERTASYAGAALDALLLVDLADAGLRIHGDGIHRACTPAGTD